MAIDPAADLEDVFDSGDFTPLTGTLRQDGSNYAFTKASVANRRTFGDGGNKEREELSVFFLASDLGVEPQRDATVALTGDSGAEFLVERVTPVQGPDNTAAGYQADLFRHVERIGREE